MNETSITTPQASTATTANDDGNIRRAVTRLAPLDFGGAVLDVAVLDDGTRAITGRGVLRLLAVKLDNFGRFYDRISNNSAGFTLRSRISFKTIEGPVAHGIDAVDLADLCGIFTDLALVGALHPKQRHIQERARVVERALRCVGIIALIDEATGYQSTRPKGELQATLRAWLNVEAAPWHRAIPEDLYVLVCALHGWPYTRGQSRRPQALAGWTWRYVYQFLPAEIRSELRRVNPEPHASGTRHHQLLTPMARKALDEHCIRLTTVLRQSTTPTDFDARFEREFRGGGLQLDLLGLEEATNDDEEN